jgi:16S rRNA (guanine1516-N2)-methyltransferase
VELSVCALSDSGFLLESHEGVLQLLPRDSKRGGPLLVDFRAPSVAYRRNTSGIKQEIARAVGCKPGYRPTVFDATAGLGSDAFVLASLGCHVTLAEQHPVVFALLEDGLKRARQGDDDVAAITTEFLQLLPMGSALMHLAASAETFDVVYLDPMFPERQKSASVKKAMQYLHEVVGIDHQQEEELFRLARSKAGKRVVVKRSRHAPDLVPEKPSYRVEGKAVRYDVYL